MEKISNSNRKASPSPLLKINEYIITFLEMRNALNLSNIGSAVVEEIVWEVCLDFGVLFKKFGFCEAFVKPFNESCEYIYPTLEKDHDFDRMLFPEYAPTHEVVCLPKEKKPIFNYQNHQIVDWNQDQELHLNNIIEPRSMDVSSFDLENDRKPRGIVVCYDARNYTRKIYFFNVDDCDFYLQQIDPTKSFSLINNIDDEDFSS